MIYTSGSDTVHDRIFTVYDRSRFNLILSANLKMSKAKHNIWRKTDMKESNEKKITTLKVYKVILIIYTIVMIGSFIYTIYGWSTGASDNNYVMTAAFGAIYCALATEYESLKKKETKEKVQ